MGKNTRVQEKLNEIRNLLTDERNKISDADSKLGGVLDIAIKRLEEVEGKVSGNDNSTIETLLKILVALSDFMTIVNMFNTLFYTKRRYAALYKLVADMVVIWQSERTLSCSALMLV